MPEMMKHARSTAILLVAPIVLAACAPAGAPPSPVSIAIAVSEATVETGPMASSLSYSGTVSPRWTVQVVPRAGGQIVELSVETGQMVQTGDLLAVLDHRALDDQVAQARANVRAAEARLNSLLAGARSEDVTASQAGATAAEAGIVQAQANLEAAQLRLSAGMAGGRPETVAQAQARLNADRAALDKLLNGPPQHDINQARLAVAAAKDRLWLDQTSFDFQQSRGLMSNEQRRAGLVADQLAIDQAQEALNKLLAPPRAEDVAALQAAIISGEQALVLAQHPLRAEDIAQLDQAVAAAQAQLAQAEQQAGAQRALAAKAASPFTVHDLAQARAAVEVAQAALQAAQTFAADARITAPASGTVSDVPVAIGSLVGPQSPLATLISSNLEVTVSVEEGQVPAIEVGQPAVIVGPGGTAVPAEVFLVAPAADARSRKFPVKVRPLGPSPLRAGMSATVTIEIATQANATLVPKEAVLQRSGQEIVFVDVEGRARMRTVQTGLGDGVRLPVLGGLRPGDVVILPGSLNLSDGDAVTPAVR